MKQLAFLFLATMVALSVVSCGGSKSESVADSVAVDTIVADSAAVDTSVAK
jgi:hypothetical protein